jgi:hypothetical protein
MTTPRRSPAAALTRKKTAAKKAGTKKSAAAGSARAAALRVSVDEASGAAALKRVRPRLMSLKPTEIMPLTLNLRMAMVDRIEARRLKPRLEGLARLGEFELANLELLPDLARAAYYVRHKLEQNEAVASSAMLPLDLATLGQEQRVRMLKVLGFFFDEDPAVGPRLAYIRKGTGYSDLADDLLALSELYRRHRKELAGTARHYRTSDEKDAANTAAEIIRRLRGEAEGSAELADLARRAGVLLLRAYDEVAAAARFLCRAEPDAEALFPSLFAIGRGPRSPGAPGPDGDKKDPDKKDPDKKDPDKKDPDKKDG